MSGRGQRPLPGKQSAAPTGSGARGPTPAGIIFDWNEVPPPAPPPQRFDLFDETLRDGLQSPSVTDPSIGEKLELIELIDALGIQAADVGVPGAGQHQRDATLAICRHIERRRLKIRPCCAARTTEADIAPIVEAQQRSGLRLTVYTFIGSSKIRQWAEGWDLRFVLDASSKAIDFAVREGLEVAYVTEDTTRASPRTLEPMLRSAVDHGASRLVLADSVGHATPDGARALVKWTLGVVEKLGAEVKLDWHGHNDRGLALPNAIAALEAGAHRIHACGLGIGERVGNTSMDLLLLNLKLMGWIDQDLRQLVAYVEKVSEACRFPIPRNYPLSGADAFRTATGVHAAAIAKAERKGDDWLADRIYSAVPAAAFGKRQQIEIGPMSGLSNVKYWCRHRGIEADDELCRAILADAKALYRTLTDEELLQLVAEHRPVPRAANGRRVRTVRRRRPGQRRSKS